MENLHKEHDILLLMLSLAQVKNIDKIISLYVEAMNSLWQNKLSFKLRSDSDAPAGLVEMISTSNNFFGQLIIDGNFGLLTPEDIPIIRNSVRMLAIILENRHKDKLISEENLRLDAMVKRRTSDLIFANNELEKEVAQRKKIELDLRASEQRYRQIIEQTDNLVIEISISGSITFINQSSEKILDLPPESCLGRSIYDFIHPDDVNFSRDQFRIWLKNKLRSVTLENRLVSANGIIRDMLWNINLYFDEQGKFVTIESIARDITERKKAEDETKRTKQMLQNIIDSMPSIVIGVDHLCRVTHWNQQAELLTGLPAEKALNQPIASVFGLLQKETDAIKQAVEDKMVKRIDKLQHKTSTATEFYAITIYPLQGESQLSAVIRLDDITEQVLLEEKMIQSEKIMLVGNLAASIAHEINNPLASILNNIQVIRNRFSFDFAKNKQAADECNINFDNMRQYLLKRDIIGSMDSIFEQGQRIARIVDDTLNFSRKKPINYSMITMSELLDATLNLANNDFNLTQKYDFKKIIIQKHYQPDLPPVEGDFIRLQQVFLNLLKNGAQAMHELGPRHKSIFDLAIRQDGDFQIISIKDNGPGMDESILRKIFEPFYTTKPIGSGFGLGLFVSYSIITQNHHGKMNVYSEVNNGTSFEIALPLKQPHETGAK